MKQIIRLVKKFIYERRLILFYSYDSKQGEGCIDPRIQVYEKYNDVPEYFRKTILPRPWINTMYFRMKRDGAKLLCYSEDGIRLLAYGWIQDWHPFRHRFRAIAKEGVMLGFYWTAPAARGQGLYGRLLSHSLHLCKKEKPIIIATSPKNIPSQKGIEKAGVKFLGKWDFLCCLRLRIRFKKICD